MAMTIQLRYVKKLYLSFFKRKKSRYDLRIEHYTTAQDYFKQSSTFEAICFSTASSLFFLTI